MRTETHPELESPNEENTINRFMDRILDLARPHMASFPGSELLGYDWKSAYYHSDGNAQEAWGKFFSIYVN